MLPLLHQRTFSRPDPKTTSSWWACSRGRSPLLAPPSRVNVALKSPQKCDYRGDFFKFPRSYSLLLSLPGRTEAPSLQAQVFSSTGAVRRRRNKLPRAAVVLCSAQRVTQWQNHTSTWTRVTCRSADATARPGRSRRRGSRQADPNFSQGWWRRTDGDQVPSNQRAGGLLRCGGAAAAAAETLSKMLS